MKYPIFALLALSLFSLASCQNNPSTVASDSASNNAADNTADAAPSIQMSAEPSKLNEQVLTDFLAAKALTRQYTPAYDESMEAQKAFRKVLGSLGESEKVKILPLIREAMRIRISYDELQVSADNLDSLSTRIGAKTLTIEDAQKEYAVLRQQMYTAAGNLPKAQEALQAAKSEFERAYPSKQ